MNRKQFKRVGDSLSFNSAGAEPIFKIVQELEDGYTYFLKTTPYGDLKFVWKELVKEEEAEEVKEEVKTKK